MELDCACLQDAKNMTLAVTALALVIAEGKDVEELNLLANFFNGISAQLGLLASYDCRRPTSDILVPDTLVRPPASETT